VSDGRRRRVALAGEELRKVPAFARRDLLVQLSYRGAFVADAFGLLLQVTIFYFVGKMVDPSKVPGVSGPNAYVAFVSIGIALAAFMALALGKVTMAIQREHLIGTLESLLVTPTRYTTLQLGSVAWDMVYVPLRTCIFLALVAVLYDIDFTWSGLPAALLVLLTFIPFVWGLGVVSAAAVLTFRRGAGLVAVFASLLSLGSGAYFPLDLFPGWIEAVVRHNPVAIAMSDARAAMLDGASVADVAPGAGIVLLWACFTLTVGLAAFRAAVARERRAGTIGLY
jgi:ABC-2 type transport system permease protein